MSLLRLRHGKEGRTPTVLDTCVVQPLSQTISNFHQRFICIYMAEDLTIEDQLDRNHRTCSTALIVKLIGFVFYLLISELKQVYVKLNEVKMDVR